MAWERARHPDQKAERREAILASAARCFDQHGLSGATLSAIASGAGLSKGNLYHYFESREAILMALFLRETHAWLVDLESRFLPLAGCDDVDTVAIALTDVLVAHPRMCALSAFTLPVLEQQLSVDAVVAFKLEAHAAMGRAIHHLAAALPHLSEAQVFRVARYTNLGLGQVWALTHPGPQLAEAMGRPELSLTPADFRETLLDYLTTLLRGT